MARPAFQPSEQFREDITPWRPAMADEIAAKYGVSRNTVRNYARKLHVPGFRPYGPRPRPSSGMKPSAGSAQTRQVERQYPSFPPSPVAPPAERLLIEGDVLVLFDMHIPHYDSGLLDKACRLATRLGVTKVLFGGDLFSHDVWNPRHASYDKRRYQDDLALACEIMAMMIDDYGFDLHSIMGNHDAWLYDYLRGQIEPDFMLPKLTRSIRTTTNEWCDVVSDGVVFRIEHGANYSSANPLNVAQKLSAKYQLPVVMGHQHHVATGWDFSGTRQCIASGGLFDPKLIHYHNERHKTNPAMTQGFVIIREGWATHYSPGDPLLKTL